MTKRLGSFFFWFCIVMSAIDVFGIIVDRAIGVRAYSGKVFFLLAAVSSVVGALANYLWLQKQSSTHGSGRKGTNPSIRR